jgi:hypothetical protein
MTSGGGAAVWSTVVQAEPARRDSDETHMIRHSFEPVLSDKITGFELRQVYHAHNVAKVEHHDRTSARRVMERGAR